MKIYLGPWKIGKGRKFFQKTTELSYFRPVLWPKHVLMAGIKMLIGPPEIFFDEGKQQFVCYDASKAFDMQEYFKYGTAEELMDWLDKRLLEKGYGSVEGEVVLLSQEDFDKLNILK